MCTCGMITCSTLYINYNIAITLVAHLQKFLSSCYMQLQCNIFKNQTWLITYVCTMCINYHIKGLFSNHLQLLIDFLT